MTEDLTDNAIQYAISTNFLIAFFGDSTYWWTDFFWSLSKLYGFSKWQKYFKSLVLQLKRISMKWLKDQSNCFYLLSLLQSYANVFSSKVKLSSKKGETCYFKLIFQDPTPIRYSKIHPMKRYKSLKQMGPRRNCPTKTTCTPKICRTKYVRLKHIKQFHDGKIKLSFVWNSQDRIDEYLFGSSNPETIHLGRVSQLGQDFPREEKSMKFRPRFSNLGYFKFYFKKC